MGKIVEGLWDCKYCSSTGIGGSKRECPNCGKTRDENTRFYLPRDIKSHYVEDERTRTINRNPDWICQYCNCLNSDSDVVCKSCGAQKTSLDYFKNIIIKERKENFAKIQEYDESSFDKQSENLVSKIKSESFSVIWKKLLIITIIISIIVGIFCFLFIPRVEKITVNEMGWKRSISIESYQTVQENDWNIPTGGRLLYTKQEISGYEEVLDHYEEKERQIQKEKVVGYESYVAGYRDLGNGYFEEITDERPIYETYYETETYTEPVYKTEAIYQTKYYYEIDKWLYERSVVTNGLDKNPYWGKAILKNNEREAEKTETYYIKGTDGKNRNKKITIEYEQWINLKTGDIVKIKKSLLGTGKVIN